MTRRKRPPTQRRGRRGQPIQLGKPHIGWFKTRARTAAGSVWVPARVMPDPDSIREPGTFQAMDRAVRLMCIVAGERRDLETTWPWLHEIRQDEYEAMTRDADSVDRSMSRRDHPVRL